MERDRNKVFTVTSYLTNNEWQRCIKTANEIRRISSEIFNSATNRFAEKHVRIGVGLDETPIFVTGLAGHVMQKLEDGTLIAIMSEFFTKNHPFVNAGLAIERKKKNPSQDAETTLETYYFLTDKTLRTLDSSENFVEANEEQLTSLLADVKKIEIFP